MKVKSIGVILLIIFVFLSVSACADTSGISETPEAYPNTMPEDFSFKLNFGIDGKNSIDTYSGTFIKDLIIAGTETIDFSIPEEIMREFYEAFIEYGIFDLSYNINDEANIGAGASRRIPSEAYILLYTCNSETKTVNCEDGGPWDATNGPPNSRDRFVAFVDTVREYIYSTEEYQNMSPAQGAYH